MYPKRFQYVRPDTLEEAVALLAQHGEGTRVLAGGQSLIPMMKLRISTPKLLIDINRITALAQITEREGAITFGALTRHATIEESRLVKSKLRVMHEAACVIGDVQVRGLGTIGGSLAHADPAGDWAPTLLAVNAQIRCRGPRGERVLKIDELLADAYTTNLGPDEILTEVSVPEPGPDSGGVYLKLERKAGDFAVVSVAVQIAVEKDGSCRDISIGLGAVGLTAIRPRKAESLLRGKKINDALIKSAAEQASQEADPLVDLRGLVEYKRHLVKVLFERALNVAIRRARGEEMGVAHA